MKHCQFNQREQKIQIGRKSGIRNWPLLTKMNRAHRQYMHVQCTHTHNGRKKNRHSVTHIQNAVYSVHTIHFYLQYIHFQSSLRIWPYNTHFRIFICKKASSRRRKRICEQINQRVEHTHSHTHRKLSLIRMGISIINLQVRVKCRRAKR